MIKCEKVEIIIHLKDNVVDSLSEAMMNFPKDLIKILKILKNLKIFFASFFMR